jgi:phage terminase small subunit
MEVEALGRNAKPIELHTAAGNPNRLTKAEIDRRKSAEIIIKNHTFKASLDVMADERALQEFKRLKKLFKEIEFIGSYDEHIINQYCLSVSELDDLLVALNIAREQMKSLVPEDRKEGLRMFMAVDVEVRMKRQEIIRLSDRLYLNPVARTKNVPRKKNEEAPKNKFSKFAGGASG